MASAHASYFRSLANLGEALHRFVHEELALEPPSPLLVISSSKSCSSATSLCHSLSSEGSHLRFSSTSDSEARSGDIPSLSVSPIPNCYYSRSSTTIPSYSFPIKSPSLSEDRFCYYNDGLMMSHSLEATAAATPPPPSPGSAWDFFNPFFEPDNRYRMASTTSSTNSSEIREKEGIPDLEEDTDLEPPKQMDNGFVLVEKETNSSSIEMESKTGSVVKEGKSTSFANKARSNGGGREVGFNGDIFMTTEERGMRNENWLAANGSTIDILEALDEVKVQFNLEAGFGEEVSRMLEVGKLPHSSRFGIFRDSFKHERHSGAIPSKDKAVYADFEKHISLKCGDLSKTLEKLYVWEKKLYKEVKDEEKLWVIYYKKCKQLNALVDRGAECYKIDSTQASVRKLSTKLSVSFKTIDAISRRMHKIRDEELRPQLIELIQGLIRMWRSVLNCHQTQFQAMANSKIDKVVAKFDTERNSIAKSTRVLQIEVLDWCSCFKDFISTQRAYVESLNGWLMKWALLEQESSSSEGILPVALKRIGAPAAFIIVNDWYHAMKRISGVEVIKAMHNFAASVQSLWEIQYKEHCQKLKVEFLSRDFSKRLKHLQKQRGTRVSLDIRSETNNGRGNQDPCTMALNSTRKRLKEERSILEEKAMHVQETAYSSLRNGLIPVLEALSDFGSQTLKAYERVRI